MKAYNEPHPGGIQRKTQKETIEELGNFGIKELSFQILKLSFGLPPFGRIPSFDIRNSNLFHYALCPMLSYSGSWILCFTYLLFLGRKPQLVAPWAQPYGTLAGLAGGCVAPSSENRVLK
jgi:hypothetical protein